MSDKRKVRTTLRPDVEVEVAGPEYMDLKRQGLLIEAPVKSGSTTPPADAPVESPATQKGAK